MKNEVDKLDKLAGEYNATFSKLELIESELTKELQKYVNWDTIQVSITGSCIPVVKAKGEIDAIPLNDFIDHVKEHNIMSDTAYGHLAYI